MVLSVCITKFTVHASNHGFFSSYRKDGNVPLHEHCQRFQSSLEKGVKPLFDLEIHVEGCPSFFLLGTGRVGRKPYDSTPLSFIQSGLVHPQTVHQGNPVSSYQTYHSLKYVHFLHGFFLLQVASGTVLRLSDPFLHQFVSLFLKL